ncbi:MFS transporter [Natronorubrum sp. FCH18a]|uniref:MFS transporter n=1 Tax=Natronorubrum sp. FCH18a TaxID=3447018 RepID=UPI003F50F1A9
MPEKSPEASSYQFGKRLLKGQWSALGLMLTVQIIGSLAFLAITALTPFIRSEFGLSSSAVGLLIVTLYLGYFLTLIPGGVLTDVFGERLMLSIGLILIGLFSIAIGLGTDVWILAIGLFALGCGYSVIPPGTNKGVYDWFPPEQLGTGLGIKQTGVMIGGGIGAALLPVVATDTDWRVAFAAVGGCSLLSLVLLAVYSPPPDIGTNQHADKSAVGAFQSQIQDLIGVYNTTRLSPLLIVGFLFGASQFTLMAYAVLYLTEHISLRPTTAGLLYTGMQLAGVGSRILFGYLADDWFPRSKHRLLFLIGIGGAGAYLALLSASPSTPLPFVAVAVVLIGGLALGYNGVYLAMANELVGANHTGASTSIAITAVMLGAIITPPVFGLIVDITASYTISLGVLAAVMLLAGVFSTRIEADIEQPT